MLASRKTPHVSIVIQNIYVSIPEIFNSVCYLCNTRIRDANKIFFFFFKFNYHALEISIDNMMEEPKTAFGISKG